jgi:GntR family transcriptional repressor for pyruvate dehydrogenase complex
MPLSTAITLVSVVDAIEARIKEMIMSGKSKPGDQLPSERVLQSQLGVSRLPLREALARLQALGLISIRHGKGAYVEKSVSRAALSAVLIPFYPNQSPSGLRELVEARGFLESELTALATIKATPEDHARLDELAGNDLQLDGDSEAFAEAGSPHFTAR